MPLSRAAKGDKDDPWKDYLDFVPEGFKLSAEGLFLAKSDKIQAGPCWPSHITRSSDSLEWGIEIQWIDQDGHLQSGAFPLSKVHDRGITAELASRGLTVVPRRKLELMDYFCRFKLPDTHRKLCVSKLGWLDRDPDQSPIFVLPDKIIGGDVEGGEPVVFQPDEFNPTVGTIHAKGNLKQWQTNVAKPCIGHHYLEFALCAAFVGPLMKSIGVDCFGFHFYGSSSKGKLHYCR